MNDGEILTFLKDVIPIFTISKVKLFWCGEVNKIGQTNNLNKRLFVIASPGIFLIHQRSFAFQSHLSSSISFYELNAISLNNNNITFSGKNTQIRIRSSNAQTIALETFTIRQALFPTDVLPLNFSFSDDTNFERNSMKPIPLDTIFLDRTLSCINYLCPTFSKANENVLNYITNAVSKTLTIDEKFLSSPALQPIILSLAYEQDLNHLHFIGIKLADFFGVANILIRVNRFIKHVTLENIDFSDPDKKIEASLKKKHAFKPSWWSFVNCNLTTQDFLAFFEKIYLFDASVTNLEVKKCIAGDMVTFFQTIFFNDCFHSLQMISIDAIENPSFLTTHIVELAGCSWALEKKCLNKIIIKNCGIDGSFLLEQLLKFDFGLTYIDLSSNNCEAPIHQHKGNLTFIGLSNCRTTKEFMCSLFKAIAGGLYVSSLDISSIKIESDNLGKFLSNIRNLELPIQTLNASGIEMKSANTQIFADFLSRQTHLKDLSIDDSVNISDSPEGLQALAATLCKLPIKRLSFACEGPIETRCSSLIIPLIQGISGIKSLDVTNQRMGENGLKALTPLLDQLDELYFDGSGAPLPVLLDFCRKCIDSHLMYTKFPSEDVKTCFSAVQKPLNYAESQNAVKELKEKFEERFHRESNRYTQSLVTSTRSRKTMTRSVSTVIRAKSTEDFSVLCQRNHEMTDIYTECVGEKASEPIVAFTEQLEMSLSISQLASEL